MNNDELREKIKELLTKNMIEGKTDRKKIPFNYTKPSPEKYPFQFFWDTCFHVFILNSLDMSDLAKKHLYSLFQLQHDDGFVGHMIFWNRVLPGRITDIFQSKPGLKLSLFKTHMSALIQPPLVAKAVESIFKRTRDYSFLIDFIPKLKKYYRWLADNRDFDGDGLLTIISPFESGMDWKATFDPVLGFAHKKADWTLFIKAIRIDFKNFIRNYNLSKIDKDEYFHVKEVGFNTIYVQNLYILADLCHEINDQDEIYFRTLADKASKSMMKIMYDEKTTAFLDVYGKANKKIHILTPTIFFPVVLKHIPRDISKSILDKHLFHSDEFMVDFPLPSLAINDAAFNPTESIYIWRGTTWIFFNWFLHDYLIKHDYEKETRHLIESVKNLIDKSGFREYYHPFTGEGFGARDFTWGGLVIDMLDKEREAFQNLQNR